MINAVAIPEDDILSNWPVPLIVVKRTIPERTLIAKSENAMITASFAMLLSSLRKEP